MEGDALPVGHPEPVRPTRGVLQAKQVVNVVSSRCLPQLGRQQHRHLPLDADGVHLLLDDRLDLAHHPLAERQGGVEAGADLAHETAADEEPMADRLGVGRVVLQGGQEEAGRADDRHLAAAAFARPRAGGRWIWRPSATSAASLTASASVGCAAMESARVSMVASAVMPITPALTSSVACGPTITSPSSSP